MAVVPIKFRCYACNQLLGVSPTKVGAVVSCPKCSADLVVPSPDDSAPTQEPEPDEPGRSATTPTLFIPPEPRPATGAMDVGVALDFLDIRPEDIRVEPGVHHDLPPYRPTPAPATVVMPVPERSQPVEPQPEPVPDRSPIVSTIPPEPVPIIAPIRVDTPAPRTSRKPAPQVRSRDLILPRSVVASWSLFVLLALVSAFFAGLFAGHYVWRVH